MWNVITTLPIKRIHYLIVSRTNNPLLISNVKQTVRHNNTRLLDTHPASNYNILRAEVAQSVEQRTENPRVPSSILGLGTKTRAEVVQR